MYTLTQHKPLASRAKNQMLNQDPFPNHALITLSPATFFGFMPFMIQTASITILTPSGGRCMALTSTTSFLFNDFKLATAASYKERSIQ